MQMKWLHDKSIIHNRYMTYGEVQEPIILQFMYESVSKSFRTGRLEREL
jgi:hypothetical protein